MSTGDILFVWVTMLTFPVVIGSVQYVFNRIRAVAGFSEKNE